LYSTRSAALSLAENGDVWIGWIAGDAADRHRTVSRMASGGSAFDPPRKLDQLSGALRSLGIPADSGLLRILSDGAVEAIPYGEGGPKRIGEGACPYDPPIRGRGAWWLRAADHSALLGFSDDGARARVAHESGPACGTRLQILNLPNGRTEIVWSREQLEGIVWTGKGASPSRSKEIRIEKGVPAQVAAAADGDGFALLVWATREGVEGALREAMHEAARRGEPPDLTPTEGQWPDVLRYATRLAVDSLVTELVGAQSRIAETVAAIQGLVADVTESEIIINKGTRDGVRVGVEYDIVRGGREIRDPASGRVLRRMTEKVGKVKITSADEESAVGTVTGAPVRVGDCVGTCPVKP